ncbi:MAG: hypothetical protein ACI84E_001095, partial [Planctomycetota bacterium]
MKKAILILSACLIAGLSSAAPAQSTSDATIKMLKLRDGSILWGDIEAHTEADLMFHRRDTGGIVNLPWSFLDPGQEHELRLAYGYIASDYQEEMISAERIPLVDGTELIGVILSRENN